MKKYNISIVPGGRTFSYIYDRPTGIMRCDPLPTEEELKTVYGSAFDYGWYRKRYALKREQAKNRWKAVRGRITSGPLLDIGCGHGLFLDFAKQAGVKTYGADFPSDASREAASKGHEVFEGGFLDIDFEGAKFGAITMWHSLEHFIDPAAALKKVSSLLADNGVLIIAVPNLGCRGFDARGEAWVWVQQPFFHIWHWTQRALEEFTRKSGFVTKALSTRDTWDANIIYDGYIAWWFEKGIYLLAGAGDWLPGLVFKGFDFFREKAAFAICETARVFFYLLSLPAGRMRKDDLQRSEILLVCSKKNDVDGYNKEV